MSVCLQAMIDELLRKCVVGDTTQVVASIVSFGSVHPCSYACSKMPCSVFLLPRLTPVYHSLGDDNEILDVRREG